uniref:N-acetyltransferase domain-containing protein n=1 Tax=Anopheles dirus TaxID=7168 RepID=A0A182NI21_9DIPT
MRLNEHVQIKGTRVILVPYEKKHVEKYHQWMQSEELQELTASEPLSLEEEYQMQSSWREDNDKCTFLILDAHRYAETQDEIGALVGDTNIFLKSSPGEAPTDPTTQTSASVGEIEIMIAEPAARQRGLGWEATVLMLLYGVEHLHIERYVAITKDTNAKAMRMFGRMQFDETLRTPVFQEVTFERAVDAEWIAWLKGATGPYGVVPYVSVL